MEFGQNIEQFKGKPRLPEFAVPGSYDLTLKFDLSSCSFSGSLLVDVSINGTSKFLVLNALELAIHQASFTSSRNQKSVPSNIIVDTEDEILVLVFHEALDMGHGVLEVRFSGILNEYLKGLYRCTYLDKGEMKNMVATQFEAVEARRCFPCWDEPALKATFKISLENIPSELTALSNMPISEEKHYGDHKTVCFESSIKMSTYLVAIVVGLFDYAEETTRHGVKVRAYCPPGNTQKGKFALNTAVRTLEFFQMYFSMPYPLPKLDMVAVPEFSGGAMENYGLITFRENELLLDDLHSAAANVQRITIVVAHEVAHHWFGNLVTMEWWTHLWLNEGFATWASYLVTDRLFPEWNIWNHFLKDMKYGLWMDALEESHPIEVEVPVARGVDEYVDAISYQKGSSVIRMLQNYLGDDTFQKSLGSYMKKYAYGNAKTEDLWSVLYEESGVEVNIMMDTWTKQKGYPVISVKKLNDFHLEFSQSQFLSSGALDSDAQWIVPMTLSFGSYDERFAFLLEEKHGNLVVKDDAKSRLELMGKDWWIKVNTHQAGFYRVKYDDKLMVQLQKALSRNCLAPADEFGILDDLVALCEACIVPFSSLLDMINAYRKDLDYVALSGLIDACYRCSKILQDAIPEVAPSVRQFFASLLQPHAEKLGWDSEPGESRVKSLMREEVLLALANFDHHLTQHEAMERFHSFLEDRSGSLLPVDARKAAYTTVMKKTSHSDRSGLKSLQQVYREVDAKQEKARILRCLGSCPDPVIVSEVLDFMLTDEVPAQDVIYMLPSISLEGRASAWNWFTTKFELILKKWEDGFLLTYFVRSIVRPFSSMEMANEVEAFFDSHHVPSVRMNLQQSLEFVRIKAKWRQHIMKEHQQLLKRFTFKEVKSNE